MKVIKGREAILKAYSGPPTDESRATIGMPTAVFYPENVDDIETVVRDAAREHKDLTIMGGRTGITAGCAPCEGSYVLSFEKMDKILQVESDNRGLLLRCEPGVTIEQIKAFCLSPETNIPGSERLSPGEWFYPPDPTETTARLGGTIATNASGARSFRFGSTRNHVESLSVITAEGDRLEIRRGEAFFSGDSVTIPTNQGNDISIPAPTHRTSISKAVCGYYAREGMDLIDLFIGSEGTLGVFCEIVIRLSPSPHFLGGLSFFDTNEHAFSFADFLRAQDHVAAVEFFDHSALSFMRAHMEEQPVPFPELPLDAGAALYWEYLETDDAPFEDVFEGWEAALTVNNSSFESTWSGFDTSEMDKLKAFRHTIPELVNQVVGMRKREIPSLRKIGTDTAVPVERFPIVYREYTSLLNQSNVEWLAFGHLGDCHLHFNLLPKTDEELNTAFSLYRKMMRIAVRENGCISAEHGIGKIKTEHLADMAGPEALASMRRVKQALDPHFRLNRGNLFSADED